MKSSFSSWSEQALLSMSQMNFSGFSRNSSIVHLNLASPEIVVKRNNHRCKSVIGVYIRYIMLGDSYGSVWMRKMTYYFHDECDNKIRSIIQKQVLGI